VGRPFDRRNLKPLVEAFAPRGEGQAPASLTVVEEHASNELAAGRWRRARALLYELPAPPLDEASLRLGAAVHNLLLLSHPALGDEDAAADRTRLRVAEAAEALADVGPPDSAGEAVRRHSLLARLPEIVQPERVVSYWLGKQRYVGRTPPARILAMPRLRRVRLEETRRHWLREVGITSYARPAWAALQRASPLGEALDPLRLDPPLAWGRLLSALRFPALGRLIAGRVLELGLVPAGGALAAALFSFAALRAGAGQPGSRPAEVVFAIRFLAHVVWLELLFGGGEVDEKGGDLAALLVAAAAVDPRLVFPPDVTPGSDVGRRMVSTLSRWGAAPGGYTEERFRMALDVCRHAAVAAPAPLE
jgi:hypothetical protein